MKHILMQLCICDRRMQTRGAYDSYRLKGLHKDRVFGYDAITRDDAFVYLITIRRYVEQVSTT